MKTPYPAPPHPDVQKMMDKFPETYQIVKMLKHFENKYNQTNQNLSDSGEGSHCKSWKDSNISVQDIVDYVYTLEEMNL